MEGADESTELLWQKIFLFLPFQPGLRRSSVWRGRRKLDRNSG